MQHQRVDVHREEDGNDSSTSSQKKRGRGRPPGPRAAKLAAKAAMKIQSRDGWQERQQRGAAAVAATIIASSSSSSSTKAAVASTSKSSTTMNKAVNLNLAAILDLDNIDLDNWEEELNAKLLSKEQLAQIPMEEEARSYQPMQPFTMEGRAKGLVVRTFKNGGMNGFERGWKVESILGLSEENTCIVKFVGFSTLQKLPSDLVRKQAFQELCKYLDWISCKRNADKRGDYWEQKLQQPSSWMTDQARASLKIWREEQQQEEMASDADK